MQLQNDPPTTPDVSGNNGEIQLVRLNEQTYEAICILLRRQSLRDLQAFKESVQQLQDEGYPLTSLVAEVRRAFPSIWQCEVHPPKMGAKAQKLSN